MHAYKVHARLAILVCLSVIDDNAMESAADLYAACDFKIRCHF